MAQRRFPKITLVTPNYNGEAHLEETINSVLSQNYGNLEYIVVDGGSTDKSLEIINKYKSRLARVISEKDRGHSHAVNKGFAAGTGDIMGWINSDDILLPGALTTVSRVFEQFPGVAWITGRATAMSEDGVIYTARPARPWSWLRFLAGDYSHIQQESTFWRRELWQAAGAALSEPHGLAGDFQLWTRFFQHAELHTVDALIGSFRFRKEGQLSRSAGLQQSSDYSKNTHRALSEMLAATPPEVLGPHLGQLSERRTVLPSSDFERLPADLAVLDAPIVQYDRIKDAFVREERKGRPVPAGKPKVRRHAMDLAFDGKGGRQVEGGPDFAGSQFLGLDISLKSDIIKPLPKTQDDKNPAMPAVVGPIALYDLGAGEFVVQLRFGADDKKVMRSIQADSNGRLILKVVAGSDQIAVIVGGRLVYKAPRPDTLMPRFLDNIILGSGFAERHWNGVIESLRVATRPLGQNDTRIDEIVAENSRSKAQPEPEAGASTKPSPGGGRAPARFASSAPAFDINAFRNRHRGERCFVMGNGPSLNKMDLNKLNGETVFACNAAFLLFDRIGWRPRYYTCVDTRVIRDRAQDITAMLDAHPRMTSFFPSRIRLHDGSGQEFETPDIIPPAANRYYFNEVFNSLDNPPESMFSLNAAERVVQPYTVAITMLQLAAFMGFKSIYLIGCDTSYSVNPTVRQEGRKMDGVGLLLTSTEDNDANHFDPRYFGKGREWHNPQVDKMLMHHAWAYEALEGAGIEVYNATVGGQLEAYPRVDFDSLFGGRGLRDLDRLAGARGPVQ